MTDVKIETVGKIISGDEMGFYLKVIDDAQNTGGYLILTSPNKDISGVVYDGWVENYNNLVQYFKESKWIIDWLDN